MFYNKTKAGLNINEPFKVIRIDQPTQESVTPFFQSHDSYLLVLFRGVSGIRIVEEYREEIQATDLLLIPPRTPYAIRVKDTKESRNTGTGTVIFLYFRSLPENTMMQTRGFAPVIKLLRDTPRHLVFTNKAKAFAERILYRSRLSPDSFYATELFLLLLYKLSQGYNTDQDKPTELSGHTFDDRILTVLQYINQHYREPGVMSVEAIARTIFVSPSRFASLFKAYIGISCHAYIVDLRLRYASRQLLETQEQVATIALASGFNDISHFIKVFKRKYGYSPSEYRRKMQN
jgi:Transcriptional regulator containing an amidase domain and an AraC-type DNA-binding HTH domain